MKLVFSAVRSIQNDSLNCRGFTWKIRNKRHDDDVGVTKLWQHQCLDIMSRCATTKHSSTPSMNFGEYLRRPSARSIPKQVPSNLSPVGHRRSAATTQREKLKGRCGQRQTRYAGGCTGDKMFSFVYAFCAGQRGYRDFLYKLLT